MKTLFQKIRSFPMLAVICVLLLQLYMLMYGCSRSAGSQVPRDGYALYASKCGSCHSLLPPQDYSLDRWRHYVDKYGEKMTEAEKQTVLNHLRQERIDTIPN